MGPRVWLNKESKQYPIIDVLPIPITVLKNSFFLMTNRAIEVESKLKQVKVVFFIISVV